MTETFFCLRHQSHYYSPPGCLRCAAEPLPDTKRLIAALRDYKEAEDAGEYGVWVVVSKEACDDAACLLHTLDASLASVEGELAHKQWELDQITMKANESNRLIGHQCEVYREALESLFLWCEDNVAYFGEGYKGSRDEAVYRRVAKALGHEYTGAHPEHGVTG